MGRFVVRDDLRADFDFDLLVAIWPSLMSATASCAATDATPPIGRAGREGRGNPGFAIRARGDLAATPRPAGDQLHRSAARYPSKPSRLRRRFPPVRMPRRLLRCAQPRSVWNESQ